MLKLFVCALVLVVDVTPTYELGGRPQSDIPCLSFGGICVHSGDCPADKLSKIQGLCPTHRSNFVCCHSLPISETRCRYRGGECFSKKYKCPEKFTFNEATDCDDDKKCCILVN
ncbi:U-scoloptoxin(19)-Tl1a-like [Melitaea cinxia]|uniref:U-scoloptoxin(19)-Tl1a-like n=1 Tax=Melitaea cinxia TaxID=113334 RepID=UPI001E270135|nr:U-scoloptoxin(19)-Tl1a-like [Melitaea cinxia]